MEPAKDIIAIIVALVIMNVWFMRSGRVTAFRGAQSKTLREEFAAYGLSFRAMYVVGVLKVSFALALLVGLWVQGLTFWAAIGVGSLMAGALVMHLKVRDPLVKFIPAMVLLALCLVIIFA